MVAHEQINLTRRKMIRVLGWLLLIPLAGLWDLMIKRDQAREESSRSGILLADIPQGKSYYADFWIKRDSDLLEIYSLRCTHLGCRIKPALDGQLICPCHGSTFDLEDGMVIRGPAEKRLKMLDFSINDDRLTIYLE
jgi:Rieske Fe-S protein